MDGKTLLVAAMMGIAGLASAESTSTAKVWYPDDAYPLTQVYASVIGANPTATTYSVDCGMNGGSEPTKGQGCRDMPFATYTVGPSTAELWLSRTTSPDFTRGHACDIIDSATADCAFILGGREAEMGAKTGSWRDEPGESTTGVEFTEHYIPLIITAGLEKLSGGGTKASQTGVSSEAAVTTGSPNSAQKTDEASGGDKTGQAGATRSTASAAGAQETGSAGDASTSGADSVVRRGGGAAAAVMAVMMGIAAAVNAGFL